MTGAAAVTGAAEEDAARPRATGLPVDADSGSVVRRPAVRGSVILTVVKRGRGVLVVGSHVCTFRGQSHVSSSSLQEDKVTSVEDNTAGSDIISGLAG